MRTYGRTTDEFGNTKWVEVQTAANGSNDLVYVTALAQVLLLNTGESPFYGNWGIPAQQSIVQQVFPDYFVRQVKQQFSPYFAGLTIQRLASPTPTYNVRAVTHSGTTLNASVPIPT